MRVRLALALVFLLIAPAGYAHGFANGQATAGDLSPINTGFHCAPPRGELVPRAAAGHNTAALSVGHPLATNGCASAYRPIGSPSDGCSAGTQWGFWNCYGPSRAARPGTSNHGLGEAEDIPLATQLVYDQSGGAFGFSKPCSDAPWEDWHYRFCAGFSRPDPGLNLASPTLQRGSGGPGQAPYVRQLQHLLRRAGARQVTVDGDFGKKTARALKAYQRAHGLKPDGIAGPNVWAELRGPVTAHADHGHHGRVDVAGPVSGIDVSNNNGSINWDDVRKDGIEFAVVKAAEGEDYIDPYFNRARLEAIRAQGMVAGGYCFSRPRAGRTGAVEGAFCAQVLQASGYGVGDLRPVIDIEVTALPAAQTCTYARQEVETVDAAFGQKSIIYTGPSFARTYLSSCGPWPAEHPLFIANYEVSSPSIPAPWSTYAIWQHTSSAHVDGVTGAVDHDLLPGGRDALDALRLKASGQGHGGDPGDGTRVPPQGVHRHRPACATKAHAHRCHLRRRCERGHELACRAVRVLGRVDAAIAPILEFTPQVGE